MGAERASATLIIQLFGSLTVSVGGMPLPSLRTRKGYLLLAMLALHAGHPIERSTLISALWLESEPGAGAANLRRALTDLRQALGPHENLLMAQGYRTLQLNATSTQVDVLTFDALAAVWRKTGDRNAAKEAVALYHGPLLEGFDAPWVLAERAAREEICLCMMEALARHTLGEGDAAQAVIWARCVERIDSFRESGQRLLYEALAASGDLPAALRAYRDFRIRLHRATGLSPDPETVRAIERINHPQSPPVVKPSVSKPSHHLPHPLTRFFGRVDEMNALRGLLLSSDNRLVSVTGIGGIGKTRLALETVRSLSDHFSGNVWFVELSSLLDPNLLPETVAKALSLRTDAGKPIERILIDHLQQGRHLILLNNCEHLLAACARLARELILHCPRLQILTSSRAPLGIPGEQIYRVPPLSLPERSQTHTPVSLMSFDAVRLFNDRALLSRHDFQITEQNAPALAQLCICLDGIPLAIELAAARVRSLPVEQILQRLSDRFHLLTNPNNAVLPRHQTLRATMDWSYDQLTVSEKALLRRLSVFSGGCTLEAAEAVGPGESVEKHQVLDLLSALTDKSLVVYTEETERARYHFLDTVHHYALDRLRASGEEDTIRERHRGFLLMLSEEAESHVTGLAQTKWLERLDTEHDNLRLALEWRNDALSLRLAGALSWFWDARGYLAEGQERLLSALAGLGNGHRTAIRAKALAGAGHLTRVKGDSASAQALFQECLSIYREIHDIRGIARTLSQLGGFPLHEGDPTSARPYYEESLALWREVNDQRGIANALNHLGYISFRQDDFDSARALFEESLTKWRELDDPRGIGWTLSNLGEVCFEENNFILAQALFEESLTIWRKLGIARGIAGEINHLGEVSLERNASGSARAFFEESLGIFHEVGDPRGILWTLEAFGALALFEGNATRAVRLFSAADALGKGTPSPLSPRGRLRYDRYLNEARSALSHDACAIAWVQGQILTMERAVTYAMENQTNR